MIFIKILHINCLDVGSTGKIILDISRYISDFGCTSVLCSPVITEQSDCIKKYKTSFAHEQGLYKRICYYWGLQFGFAPISTFRIINIIKKEKPDVVHLHSANCYMVNLYRLLGFLKHKNIATVVTNHAEFFYTGNCSHAEECDRWKNGCGECPRLFSASFSKHLDRTATAFKKLRCAFEGNKRLAIVSVSPWVHSRAEKSPIMQGHKLCVIPNGINNEIFCIRENNGLRQELGIPEYNRIVFQATAFFSDRSEDIKGGRYLIELAKKLENKAVTFVVAGKYSVSQNTQLPKNIILLGNVSDQNRLAELYSLADVTLITSKRETFCMSVAESLCCGTPVVGFCAGGPESIAIPEYSDFVEYGDTESLKVILLDKWLEFKGRSDTVGISETAKQVFSSDKMSKKYMELYMSL